MSKMNADWKMPFCPLLAAALCAAGQFASPLSAATYWTGGGGNNTSWNLPGNWTNGYVPTGDNFYFRWSRIGSSRLATVTEDFTSSSRMCALACSEGDPFVIKNCGRTWRVDSSSGVIVGDGSDSAGIVFSGGTFFAPKMDIGATNNVNSSYARLEDTVMTLNDVVTIRHGKLSLGPGGRLVAKQVSLGGDTSESYLVFDGGTLAHKADGYPSFVPASTNLVDVFGNLSVLVTTNGGSIATLGHSVNIANDIIDDPGSSDAPGAMRFAGGGTVHLTGLIGWTGGTVIEAGTLVGVKTAAAKDDLIRNGLTVDVTDAWLDKAKEAVLVNFDQFGGRFTAADIGKVFLASGSAATTELPYDREELILSAPVVHTSSLSGTKSLANLSWSNGGIASAGTRDVLVVNITGNSTLQISGPTDVMAVKLNIYSGKTLTLNGAANLKAARVSVHGGGTLVLDGAFGALGGMSVEAGTMVRVSNAAVADALLGSGLTVLKPEKLLDLAGDVPLVTITGSGQFARADLARAVFPVGVASPAWLSSNGKAINIGLKKYTATTAAVATSKLSELSWSPALPASLATNDMLVVNVGSDTTLDVDVPAHPFAVKLAVASGRTVTLSGREITAPYIRVDGGKAVASAKARMDRLLGNGTFAVAEGVSGCEFRDVSGFTGTLDAGGDGTRTVLVEGCVSIDTARDEIVVVPGAMATVGSSTHPLASGTGLTVKGALRVRDGATFFASESGQSSGGKLIVEAGAVLRLRFTESGVAPKVQQSSGQSIIQ